MNLRDLRYLVALAEHRHFGRAAEASFVSQPTLSTQIKKLEDELGVALVERTPRKVLLTEVGREIAEHGLPTVSHLTVTGAGQAWTDQQWLAQLVLYGLARVGDARYLDRRLAISSAIKLVPVTRAGRADTGGGLRAGRACEGSHPAARQEFV